MNKSNINELSAGTESDSNSKDENQPVSQPNANTNVVGSQFKSREIKFRAWDRRLKKFYLDSSILHVSGNKIFYDCGISGWQRSNAHCEFMQYTGLKDKNGKKIYEGDISQDGGVVIWNNDDASFCWHYEGIETQPFGEESEWCEIRGNIFENPELLHSVA